MPNNRAPFELNDSEDDDVLSNTTSTVHVQPLVRFPRIASSLITHNMCGGCGKRVCCHEHNPQPRLHPSCLTNLTASGFPKVTASLPSLKQTSHLITITSRSPPPQKSLSASKTNVTFLTHFFLKIGQLYRLRSRIQQRVCYSATFVLSRTTRLHKMNVRASCSSKIL
jgi:hypothetical protein